MIHEAQYIPLREASKQRSDDGPYLIEGDKEAVSKEALGSKKTCNRKQKTMNML